MRYLLLIAVDDEKISQWPQEEVQKALDACTTICDEMTEAGVFIAAERLRPRPTATTVRIRNGQNFTTDGPFAETKEHIGGFFMINAANDEEARKWAARLPQAKFGSIEVRAIWEREDWSQSYQKAYAAVV